MFFDTEINGIPCECHVIYYQEATPMIITGSGFGDAIPPEPEEFYYELLDSHGNVLDDLEVSNSDTESLIAQYKTLIKGVPTSAYTGYTKSRRYVEDL